MLRGHRRLGQGLAFAADPLAPDVALDREDARRVVELFADVLADALQSAAAAQRGADGGLGLVGNLHRLGSYAMCSRPLRMHKDSPYKLFKPEFWINGAYVRRASKR